MSTDLFKDPVAIATLVLAFVTVLLAIGTFLTIRQNRKFREKDRKEQLLDEIIQWGQLLASFPKSKISEGLIVHYPVEGVLSILIDRLSKQIDDIISFNGRNIYILRLSKTFNSKLNDSIIKTMNQIDALKDILIGWKKELDKEKANNVIMSGIIEKDLPIISYIDKRISDLIENAEKVIEEATKIKTESLS